MRCGRGSILILVLFVLSVLSLTAVGFAYRSGVERRATDHRTIAVQLRAQAASAAAIAIGRLMENTNDFDHRAEPWHTHGPLSAGDWLAEWSASGGEFVTTYAVIDEESKLNVLFASSQALETLGLTTEQVDSLLDWMDEDETARPDGAETSYYLQRRPPHRSKNAPLECLEELLAIRGFTANDYYGEDADHDGILDPNENDGPVSPPLDDVDGELRLGMISLLTTVGDGRINLNTAPRQVLETLPLSDGAADQIIAYRAFDAQSQGELADHVFASVEDIEQLQGLTDADRALLSAVCVFHSTHFRVVVESRHMPSGLVHRLDALLRVGEQGPEIMQWRPLP